jgi:hypothetical protein
VSKGRRIKYGNARKRLPIAFILSLGLLTPALPSAFAVDVPLTIAEDKLTGYDRKLFKHWIDADKDGCDTRAEVLIEEAIIKPKVGPKCKLTGGKWLSAYDGKTVTNSSLLDIDHVVPLAEAWRSGAWNWTAAQRQAFANELENSRVLIAVTLSTNRSKGDRDPSLWMPTKDRCKYTQDWLAIKYKFSLTVDVVETIKLRELVTECRISNFVFVENGALPSPSPSLDSSLATSTRISDLGTQITCTKDGLPGKITGGSAAVKERSFPCEVITPGAFCAPLSKVGIFSGVLYTCKPSATDTRNRWRL